MKHSNSLILSKPVTPKQLDVMYVRFIRTDADDWKIKNLEVDIPFPRSMSLGKEKLY